MKRVYRLRDTLAIKSYQGCGHGLLTVDKETDSPIDMCYLDDYENETTRQNLLCVTDDRLGKIYYEDSKVFRVFVNFSCCEAITRL